MSMAISRKDLEAALPDLRTTLEFPELQARVDVVRDRWGVPHLRAQSQQDAFFAQGFVTAQDRLWQMDYDRQRALGRWAEWVGSGGLEEDRSMRVFELDKAARADYAACTAPARAMLDA